MYREFFDLKEYPFDMTPDPRFLHLSKQHEEAIATLCYGIHFRKGFVTLTGEIGTGKTTLVREVLNRLDDNVNTSLLLNPLLSILDLLKAINQDFGNKIDSISPQDQINALNNFLFDGDKNGKNAVVLIDESQNLSFEALEMIRMLSNLETENKKLLQIILVGQPELDQKLKSHNLRQLNQRITVRYKLYPLDFTETKKYIFHRLEIAGGQGKLKFEDTAIKRIYKYSNGIPRLINVISDRALLESYVKGKKIVDKKIIKSAISDIRGGSHKFWFFKFLW
jgi:general secretion pathway protein A